MTVRSVIFSVDNSKNLVYTSPVMGRNEQHRSSGKHNKYRPLTERVARSVLPDLDGDIASIDRASSVLAGMVPPTATPKPPLKVRNHYEKPKRDPFMSRQGIRMQLRDGGSGKSDVLPRESTSPVSQVVFQPSVSARLITKSVLASERRLSRSKEEREVVGSEWQMNINLLIARGIKQIRPSDVEIKEVAGKLRYARDGKEIRVHAVEMNQTGRALFLRIRSGEKITQLLAVCYGDTSVFEEDQAKKLWGEEQQAAQLHAFSWLVNSVKLSINANNESAWEERKRLWGESERAQKTADAILERKGLAALTQVDFQNIVNGIVSRELAKTA